MTSSPSSPQDGSTVTRRAWIGRFVSALIDHVARRTRHTPDARGLGLSVLATPLALLICLALLLRQITPETLTELTQALANFSVWQWVASIALTWLSYLAIGRNEAVAHDLLATGVDHRRARRAGMQAVALAQSLGFGTITAAFARRRALPELAMWPLARLSVVASIAFLGALAALATLALLFVRTGGLWLPLSALAVGYIIIRRATPLPSLPGLRSTRLIRLMLWTALDTGCAAAALYVFLPPGLDLTFAMVLSAYLLALGAGLLSQSPGGLGALELTFVLLLPQIPAGQLLAALFAYRVTYHALPAVASILTLMRRQPQALPAQLVEVEGKSAERAAHRSGQGDWGLIHQGARVLLTRDQSAGWLTRTTAISLVAIGRPLGMPRIADLAQKAVMSGHAPLLYKCDARTATLARDMGWHVAPVSHEAVIHPAAWSVDGAERRQLRRKLRSATKAGLRVERRTGRLPYDDMRRISDQWRRLNGTERGFSMGRFAPDLVVRQLVILAYKGKHPVGFVTFHKTRNEWGLDLMRLAPDAPGGTMQMLIAAAIAFAREAGIARVSLAACPHSHRWIPKVLIKGDSWQFKKSFGPKWRPLYAAAPTKTALIAGLASTAWAIHWPSPLPKPPRERRRWARRPMFRFDLSGTTCDAMPETTQPAVADPSPEAAHSRSRSDDQRPDSPA